MRGCVFMCTFSSQCFYFKFILLLFFVVATIAYFFECRFLSGWMWFSFFGIMHWNNSREGPVHAIVIFYTHMYVSSENLWNEACKLFFKGIPWNESVLIEILHEFLELNCGHLIFSYENLQHQQKLTSSEPYFK